MTNTATITPWDRRRDKYGRTTHVASTAEGGEYGEQALVGTVVSLPKVAHSPGRKVMVNLHDPANPGRVHYFETLRVAKAFFATAAMPRAERAAR